MRLDFLYKFAKAEDDKSADKAPEFSEPIWKQVRATEGDLREQFPVFDQARREEKGVIARMGFTHPMESRNALLRDFSKKLGLDKTGTVIERFQKLLK